MTGFRASIRTIVIYLAVAAAACSPGDHLVTDPPRASETLVGAEGAPTRITIVAGNNQKGAVGQPLLQVFTVKVWDASNVGVPNVTVNWTVIAGGGTLAAVSCVTGPLGRCNQRLTLGLGGGANRARALVSGISPLTFTATGLVPARFMIVSGNNQQANVNDPLPNALVVRVRTSGNVDIPGAMVTFAIASGGGGLGTPQSQTDVAGQARTTRTLGPIVGSQTTTAQTAGLAITRTFTATANATTTTLTVNVTGQGAGVVQSTDATVNCSFNTPPTTCTYTYAVGAVLDIAGSGASATSFVGFSGDCSGLSCSLTMNQNHTITAQFAPFTWKSVAAGDDHTCGIINGGDLYCWGDNTDGQLGTGGAAVPSPRPVQVTPGTQYRAVTAGFRFTCAIESSYGQVMCWGNNAAGQLGLGFRGGSFSVPQATILAPLSPGFYVVDAGSSHICAQRFDNRSWCWGDNFYGQLGNGSNVGTGTPQSIGGPGRLEVGYNFTCTTATGSSATFCTGENFFGQLGNGSTTHRNTFTIVSGQTPGAFELTIMGAGGYHACAAASDGGFQSLGLYCWGRNLSGQVLPPAGPNYLIPVLVSSSLNVAPGGRFTCIVAWGTSTAACFGDNSTGQLGGDGHVFSVIEAGDEHACGLRQINATVNDLYCWGYNSKGQLGDGSQTTRFAPVSVGKAGP